MKFNVCWEGQRGGPAALLDVPGVAPMSALAILLLLVGGTAAQPPAGSERATPAQAVAALRAALEANDFKTLSQIVPGPDDALLRTLAEPMAKAQAAARQLDEALKEQPNLNFTNPFAAATSPFRGLMLELVEVGKEGNQNVARVKFGPKGQPPREEVLGLVSEGNSWRVSLPGQLARELRRLKSPETELQKQCGRLEGLAKVLATLAEEVKGKKLKSREAALYRLAQLVDEAKLGEEEQPRDKTTPPQPDR